MKELRVERLIFGATFTGVSAALNKDSLLIERTALIGSEFVDCLNEKPAKESGYKNEFTETLKRKNAVNENGAVYLAAAMFELCDIIKKKGLKIMMLTEVIEIKKNNGLFEVLLFNCDGYSTVFTQEIIDTTSVGILHNKIESINCQKYLNAVVFIGKDKNYPVDCTVTTNEITKKDVLHFPLPLNCEMPEAKKRFFNFLKVKMPIDFKVIYVSIHITFSDYHTWVPSCSHYNLLDSFSAGLLAGGTIV